MASSQSDYYLGHLVRSHAFRRDVPNAVIRQTAIAYGAGLTTHVVAMLTALVAPLFSFALYLLIAGYYLLPHGVDQDLAAGSAGDARREPSHVSDSRYINL